MFPIGYHIYPYRKLFVCVNTFSRDKVVVSVLLRLSLSLSHSPHLSLLPHLSGLASTSLVRTRMCTLSTRVTFGQRFDFCLSREIWAILALRIPLWYQQLRLEYYLFRQLCPLTLSAINSLPSPHAHRICWVCNIWTPQAISFSCRLHLTTFSSPTSGSSTTYCRSSKIEDTPTNT